MYKNFKKNCLSMQCTHCLFDSEMSMRVFVSQSVLTCLSVCLRVCVFVCLSV